MDRNNSSAMAVKRNPLSWPGLSFDTRLTGAAQDETLSIVPYAE